jgi:hypothetical protein
MILVTVFGIPESKINIKKMIIPKNKHVIYKYGEQLIA